MRSPTQCFPQIILKFRKPGQGALVRLEPKYITSCKTQYKKLYTTHFHHNILMVQHGGGCENTFRIDRKSGQSGWSSMQENPER